MAKQHPKLKKPAAPKKFDPRSASPKEKRNHYAARHTKPAKPYRADVPPAGDGAPQDNGQ